MRTVPQTILDLKWSFLPPISGQNQTLTAAQVNIPWRNRLQNMHFFSRAVILNALFPKETSPKQSFDGRCSSSYTNTSNLGLWGTFHQEQINRKSSGFWLQILEARSGEKAFFSDIHQNALWTIDLRIDNQVFCAGSKRTLSTGSHWLVDRNNASLGHGHGT